MSSIAGLSRLRCPPVAGNEPQYANDCLRAFNEGNGPRGESPPDCGAAREGRTLPDVRGMGRGTAIVRLGMRPGDLISAQRLVKQSRSHHRSRGDDHRRPKRCGVRQPSTGQCGQAGAEVKPGKIGSGGCLAKFGWRPFHDPRQPRRLGGLKTKAEHQQAPNQTVKPCQQESGQSKKPRPGRWQGLGSGDGRRRSSQQVGGGVPDRTELIPLGSRYRVQKGRHRMFEGGKLLVTPPAPMQGIAAVD